MFYPKSGTVELQQLGGFFDRWMEDCRGVDFVLPFDRDSVVDSVKYMDDRFAFRSVPLRVTFRERDGLSFVKG